MGARQFRIWVVVETEKDGVNRDLESTAPVGEWTSDIQEILANLGKIDFAPGFSMDSISDEAQDLALEDRMKERSKDENHD